MNPHNTLEKMRAMRLRTMAELYQQSLSSNTLGELSLDEVMATLIDAEWEDRQQRKIAGLLRRAGFRQQASATGLSTFIGTELIKLKMINFEAYDYLYRRF